PSAPCPLSLHDALPICGRNRAPGWRLGGTRGGPTRGGGTRGGRGQRAGLSRASALLASSLNLAPGALSSALLETWDCPVSGAQPDRKSTRLNSVTSGSR